jgi:hypothetical protein
VFFFLLFLTSVKASYVCISVSLFKHSFFIRTYCNFGHTRWFERERDKWLSNGICIIDFSSHLKLLNFLTMNICY